MLNTQFTCFYWYKSTNADTSDPQLFKSKVHFMLNNQVTCVSGLELLVYEA
jgi:hypothetical protein